MIALAVVLLHVFYKVALGMNMNEHVMFPRPDIQEPVSRSLHWICSIIFTFMFPCLQYASYKGKRFKSTACISVISAVYSTIDSFLLNYYSNDSKPITFLIIINCCFSGLQLAHTYYILHLVLKIKNDRSYKNFTTSVLLESWNVANIFLGFLIICLIPVAYFGTCKGSHLGQCSAHGIMGTSFILYGFIYLYPLLKPKGNSSVAYSQDFIDSCVMCAYGIVNTFTEHRWGREGWFMHDYQHTAMGIIWWCGGLLGILSSWKNKRTIMPSLILMITGWAMTQHKQKLEISTHVHYFFGLVLMLGSLMRIIEITFILKDKNNNNNAVQSFQYLPSLCLVCSGILFMSANEEQLEIVLGLGAEHSSYIMVVLSGAFLLHFWMIFCVKLGIHLSSHSIKQVEYWELSTINADSESS